MIRRVVIAKAALKALRVAPRQVVAKLRIWVDAVEHDGLEVTMQTPGFHDEPLRGKRRGFRSIRLNRKYRAIYMLKEDGNIEFVSVEEVTAHDY